MYVQTYIMTRPNSSIPWFSRTEEISRQFGIEKREGRLIFDEFELSHDELSATYTAMWDQKESYQNFIDLPMMKNFREERSVYNNKTGCAIRLISEADV